MDFIKTTEQDSNYNHLEKMNIIELLININAHFIKRLREDLDN